MIATLWLADSLARQRERAIERVHRVEHRLDGASEKIRLDLVSRVAGLVVVRMILDAEVDEWDAGGMKRAVIGLHGPVVHATARFFGLVMPEYQLHRRAR